MAGMPSIDLEDHEKESPDMGALFGMSVARNSTDPPYNPCDVSARYDQELIFLSPKLEERFVLKWVYRMGAQVLSRAVQPRALWVAAHHLELAPSMDAAWLAALAALASGLSPLDDPAKSRRHASC